MKRYSSTFNLRQGAEVRDLLQSTTVSRLNHSLASLVDTQEIYRVKNNLSLTIFTEHTHPVFSLCVMFVPSNFLIDIASLATDRDRCLDGLWFLGLIDDVISGQELRRRLNDARTNG